MTVAAITGLSAVARGESPSPDATPPRTRVDLTVALDPDARHLTGVVRLTIPNLSEHPLSDLPLWLYPNHLGDRPAALGDVNFHWLYPNGFSPAAMRRPKARSWSTCCSVSYSRISR
jgi:hypothetical protein